jgi:hypothetical protein
MFGGLLVREAQSRFFLSSQCLSSLSVEGAWNLALATWKGDWLPTSVRLYKGAGFFEIIHATIYSLLT